MADMPLTDDFIEASGRNKPEYINDINIYQCNNCGIVQNPDDFDHNAYYQDYRYSTGHSEFTKRFMSSYAEAAFEAFKKINNRTPESVLEIGSGDGQQLMCFKNFGVDILLGIEPSKYLANIAESHGIKTVVDLFGVNMVSLIDLPVDICISSYTFDHVRQPLDYLIAAHTILADGGILALEIHDFEKIVERTEYCLFEHEHTIYLTSNDISHLLEQSGFTLISINPLTQDVTRGNSLIVIASKNRVQRLSFDVEEGDSYQPPIIDDLQDRVSFTISRIDNWIRELPSTSKLVGFGAGGRGIMTIAALSNFDKISVLFDSNFESDKYKTPKTRIPIVGPDDWYKYKDAYCIVFSFGYYEEIVKSLINVGFKKERIVSLLSFYPNKEIRGHNT